MKNNNILTVILALIVGISIGIFGLSVYQSMNNDKNNQNENIDNGQNPNNSNNDGEVNDTVTSIDQFTAEKLVKKVVSEQTTWSILNLFDENKNKKSWSIDEIGSNYLGEILLNNSTKLSKAEICGTTHETNLKQQQIISSKNQGQYDCESDIFYTIDSIKDASNEVFGKELNQFLVTTYKNSSYYYYANGNIGIFRYVGQALVKYTIRNYSVKNNIASIEIFETYRSANYKINFNINGENYYFESIEKLS